MARHLLFLFLVLTACRSADRPPPPRASPTTAATVTGPAAVATASSGDPAASEKPTVPPAAGGLPLAGRDSFAVIVGVLDFADPGVAGWSKDKRKDRALYDRLIARGVPRDHIALLLDEDADHRSVMRAIAEIGGRAGAGSTLLFYYAGHGMRDAAGAPHFMAYDTAGATMSQTGIAITKVASAIRDHFRGRRVIVMADACYSGALKEVVDVVAATGRVQAASLTSAEASNLSTNNWTFTQTVLDGLGGDSLMDADRDGSLTLGELASAVGEAMKHREKQRHGFHRRGLASDLPLATVARPSVRGEGRFAAGSYALAPRLAGDSPSLDVAQIRSVEGDDRLVRFYDYNDGEERRVKTRELRPISFEHHPVGSALRVYWGGKLWDAKVLRRDGDFHFITYPGWGPEWNEWVMSDRIAPRASAPEPATGPGRVEVEWHGKWWAATILQRRGDRYLIHYEGYGDEWDEWVTEARIRRPGSSSGGPSSKARR